jgi:hypothetical protein
MDRLHAIEPRRAQLGDTWVGPRIPDSERATVYNDGPKPIALRLRWGQFVIGLGVLAAGGSLDLPASPFPQVYVEGFGAGGSFSVLASRSDRG